MINLSAIVESFLREMPAGSITNVFLWTLIIIFIVSVFSARRNIFSGFVHYTPNLLTSIGILGTFIGIVIGLLAFDVNNIDGSIGPLLDGLKTAFITSLAGMALAIVFKTADSSGKLWGRTEEGVSEHIGPEEIYNEIRSQRETTERLIASIVGDEESTLISQIRLMRSDARDQADKLNDKIDAQSKVVTDQITLLATISRTVTQQQDNFNKFSDELWVQLKEFADMLSKSATETVITALKEVISDFNRNLTEQFGENFKELNVAVGKLVEWQENYRQQLQQMGEQYEQGVKAITSTQVAVEHISVESKQIPVAMADLKVIIETSQTQLGELERHLEAFSDMRDKAVDAVPQIQETMKNMVEDVMTATKGASEQIATSSEAIKDAILVGAKEFTDNVQTTNASLTSTSDHLSKNAVLIQEQLEGAVMDVNEKVRGMVGDMTDNAKQMQDVFKQSNEELVSNTQQTHSQVAESIEGMRSNLESTIKQSSELLSANVQQSHSQVIDSVEGMQKRLESTMEEVYQAQTKEMNRAFDAVNNELKKSIGSTGDALNEQLKAMDDAMQQEVVRVIEHMGGSLGAVTEKFTKDYSALVKAMSDVVNKGI